MVDNVYWFLLIYGRETLYVVLTVWVWILVMGFFGLGIAFERRHRKDAVDAFCSGCSFDFGSDTDTRLAQWRNDIGYVQETR